MERGRIDVETGMKETWIIHYPAVGVWKSASLCRHLNSSLSRSSHPEECRVFNHLLRPRTSSPPPPFVCNFSSRPGVIKFCSSLRANGETKTKLKPLRPPSIASFRISRIFYGSLHSSFTVYQGGLGYDQTTYEFAKFLIWLSLACFYDFSSFQFTRIFN